MMKKWLFLFLALTLIFTVAGCYDDSPSGDVVGGIQDGTEPEGSSAAPSVSQTQPSETEPVQTQEPTRDVWLPIEMVKTIHKEEGDAIWRETYTYDLQGNMVTMTQYKPDGTVNYTYTMEYDEKGRLIKETSGSGNVTEYAYDSLGNQYCVNYDGTAYTLELDHLGRAIRYEGRYDTYTYTYAEDMSSYIRTGYYDSGEASEYTEYTLDSEGHVIISRRCHADGNLLYRTDYVYENGLMTQQLSYEMGSDTYVTTSHTYTYDQYGNMLTDTFDGNYYSSDYEAVYTISQVNVNESAAQRLGQ